MAHLNGNGDR